MPGRASVEAANQRGIGVRQNDIYAVSVELESEVTEPFLFLVTKGQLGVLGE